MSDVFRAVDFVLRQEDASMSGVITNDPADRGGRTRFGIAEKFHPELTSTGFFDAMGKADALVVADRIYETQYQAPLMLASVADQQTANALLSFAVNEGTYTAVKVLQHVLNVLCNDEIAIDGNLGPATLHLINSISPSALLTTLGVFQRRHYDAIIAANPSDERFRHGWYNRVTQNCQIK